jgi:subtilisin family serine protease
MNRICLLCSALLALLLWAGATDALEVSIEGDKLTLHADQVRLQAILARIADLGVRVRIDVEIDPVISASFDARDLQKGLASILKSTNYALLWESVDGPLGSMQRLAEIQVFRPGKKRLMKPLVERPNLSIVKDPRSGALYVANEILLRLKTGMTPQEFMELLKQWGATVVDSYPPLGLYKVRVPENTDVPALAEQISRHPGLAEAEPNFACPITMPYGLEPAEDPLQEGGKSSEVGSIPIAILDSGLAPEVGLEDRVLASLDAMQTDQPISDSLGHGTQMALVAAGVVKPLGVSTEAAFDNPIIPIKAFDERGFTSNFTIMRSIDFALANGARVMSLSWGTETDSGFLGEAFRYAESKGMVLLASAGNEPTGRPVYPAAYPSVIGVGALGPDGEPWEKSNHGDFVTLAAPGFATLPVGYKGDPGTYAGTSISTAYVANVVANYLSRNPEASVAEILQSFQEKE